MNAGWSLEEGRQHMAEQRQPMGRGPASGVPDSGLDEFPRIVRTRLRG